MASLDQYDDFTLYEVFYETGTELGGAFTALENIMQNKHDTERFDTLEQEHIQTNIDRLHVDKADRQAQIRFIRKWNERRKELHKETNVAIKRDEDALSEWPRIERYAFAVGTPADHPVTVFLGGQPAAGKTSGQQIAMRMHPGLVPIVGDDYRQFHPDYDRLLETDPTTMPKATAHAAGAWTGMCVDYANSNGYSTLIEGTWRNTGTVLDESEKAKRLGRGTHAILVATPPALSRIGMLSRFYGALDSGQVARWTPPEAHDETVNRLKRNVRAIAEDDSIDRFTVTNRKGVVLADTTGDSKADCYDVWLRNFERPLDDDETASMRRIMGFIRHYLKNHSGAPGAEEAERILGGVEETAGLIS